MLAGTLRRLVMPHLAALPALVVLAFLTAGCGTGADLGPGSSKSSVGSTVHVVMKSLEFSPTAVDARVGQTVMWVNEDSSPHNVEYMSGPRFTSSRPILAPGARFSLRLTAPGTVHYFCSIHPWMKATIVVSR